LPSGGVERLPQFDESKGAEISQEIEKGFIEVEYWRIKQANGATCNVGFYHQGKSVNWDAKNGYIEMNPEWTPQEEMEYRKTFLLEGFIQEFREVPETSVPSKKLESAKNGVKIPRVKEEEMNPDSNILKSREEVAGEKGRWVLRHPDSTEDTGPTAEATFMLTGEKEVKVKLENGRIETQDFELKEFLVAAGYQLVHTEFLK
jgi:hypothetical protein